MHRAARLGLALLTLAGCDKRDDRAHTPPPRVGSGTGADLPDTLSFDWQNFRYNLGSLGIVKATAGRAEFRVLQDESGTVAATQNVAVADGTPGFLGVDPPVFVDLDGDHHEEAVIPFELRSIRESLFGAFVFTMRDGNPLQLGTITTPKRAGFSISGATIKSADGTVWRWDAATKQLVSAGSGS